MTCRASPTVAASPTTSSTSPCRPSRAPPRPASSSTGLLTIDSVDRNDRDFGASFPYIALPHVDSVNQGTERTPRAPEFVSIDPTRVLETRHRAERPDRLHRRPADRRPGRPASRSPAPGSLPATPRPWSSTSPPPTPQPTAFVTVYPCGIAAAVRRRTSTRGRADHPQPGDRPGRRRTARCACTPCTATDLIADLSGFHPAGAAYVPNAAGAAAGDPHGQPTGQKGYGCAKPAPVRRSSCRSPATGTANLPADTKAVFLNVTTVNSDSAGWLIAYPCGTAARRTPRTSTSCPDSCGPTSWRPRSAPAARCACTPTRRPTSSADLMGSAPAASTFVPTVPERVLETRAERGSDQLLGAPGPVAGQTIEVKVIGFGTTKVPADAGTVLLNVTAVDPDDRRLRDGVPVRHAPCRWRRTSTSPGSRCQPRVGQGRRRRSGVHLHLRRHGPDRRHPGLLPGHGAGLTELHCVTAPAGRSARPAGAVRRHRPSRRTSRLDTNGTAR